MIELYLCPACTKSCNKKKSVCKDFAYNGPAWIFEQDCPECSKRSEPGMLFQDSYGAICAVCEFQQDYSNIEAKKYKFFKKLEETQNSKHYQHLRYGQAVVHTMRELYPKIVGEYCGTSIDPFYNDGHDGLVNKFISACFVPLEFVEYIELKEYDFKYDFDIENAESGADREYDHCSKDYANERYKEYLGYFKEVCESHGK